MLTAFTAIVLSQVLLAGLLFGTARLDRPETWAGFWDRHPLMPRRWRTTRADPLKAMQAHRMHLDRLGVAAHRAGGGDNRAA